jgi:hypothetical protein
MPYFKNDDINLLFIHIPKTGGTSLEFYFNKKFNIPLNNDCLFYFIKDERLLDYNIVINSSLQHLTYNQIIKYNKEFNIDFNNMKIITIVRNPYERIISDLFFFLKINIDTTKEEVFDIINDYLESDNYDNHNLPQNVFIIDDNKELITNLHILKTENLTNDMKDLGYSDFNRLDNINPNKINYYNYLNEKSIKIINEFYHDDFILFNYEKLPICEI